LGSLSDENSPATNTAPFAPSVIAGALDSIGNARGFSIVVAHANAPFASSFNTNASCRSAVTVNVAPFAGLRSTVPER
jgi:hypothetical protein